MTTVRGSAGVTSSVVQSSPYVYLHSIHQGSLVSGSLLDVLILHLGYRLTCSPLHHSVVSSEDLRRVSVDGGGLGTRCDACNC